MRWGRIIATSVAVVALVACGGGKSKSAANSTGSDGASLSVASSATDSAVATDASSSAAPADGEQSQDQSPPAGDQGQPAATDAPAPSGLKPLAGAYGYHAVGQTSLNGSPTSVDEQSTTTIEDLNDSDQKITTPSSSGTQITTLRYGGGSTDLLSLQIQGGVNKTFNGPAQYTPVPLAVGQAWEWTLVSTDNLTHVTQKSHVDRQEDITVNGQVVPTFVLETDITFTGDLHGSGHLTSWASPVYKLSVRNHSVLDATYATFHVTSDITADLLDLRPS